MRREDAVAYKNSIKTNSSNINIKCLSLADAFPLLRYIHPSGRQAAAAAAAAAGRGWSFSRRCMHWLGGLLRQKQPGYAYSSSSSSSSSSIPLQFVLMPSSAALAAELKTNKTTSGTPIYTLLPIDLTRKTRRNKTLKQQLQQLQQQQTQQRQQQQQQQQQPGYHLRLRELSPDVFVFVIAFKGEDKTPFFCSEEEAKRAAANYCLSLPSSLHSLLKPFININKQTLEEVINTLSSSAYTAKGNNKQKETAIVQQQKQNRMQQQQQQQQQMLQPLLLPDLRELAFNNKDTKFF